MNCSTQELAQFTKCFPNTIPSQFTNYQLLEQTAIGKELTCKFLKILKKKKKKPKMHVWKLQYKSNKKKKKKKKLNLNSQNIKDRWNIK